MEVGTEVITVVQQKPPRGRAMFSSQKHATAVPWRRKVEYNFMALLEVDSGVVDYERSPFRIPVVVDDREKKHAIDFRLRLADGRALLVDLVRPKMPMSAYDDIRAKLSSTGHHYSIVTEAQVGAQPRLANALTLLHGRGVLITEELQLRIREIMGAGEYTIEALEAKLADLEAPRPYIYAAVLKGLIRLDLSRPIAPHTLARL